MAEWRASNLRSTSEADLGAYSSELGAGGSGGSDHGCRDRLCEAATTRGGDDADPDWDATSYRRFVGCLARSRGMPFFMALDGQIWPGVPTVAATVPACRDLHRAGRRRNPRVRARARACRCHATRSGGFRRSSTCIQPRTSAFSEAIMSQSDASVFTRSPANWWRATLGGDLGAQENQSVARQTQC